MTVNGTHVPVGKGWYELKAEVICSGKPDADISDRATEGYCAAALGTAEQFGGRMQYAAALLGGVEKPHEKLLLGHGAAWTWNLADQQFPRVTPQQQSLNAASRVP